MNDTFISALPQKTIDTHIRFCIETISHKESGSILHIPLREQLYRVPEFLNRLDTLLQKTFFSVEFFSLYVSTLPVDDPVELHNYLKKNIITSRDHIVLFIVGADLWVKNNSDLIGVLDNFAHSCKPTVSCIYLFQTNITNDFYQSLFQFGSLYQNTHIFPFFTRNDMQQFIGYLENKFNANLPKKVTSEILNQCGGSMWLIKQAFRHFIKNGEMNLFNQDAIMFRLNVLYNEFLPTEHTALQKIIMNDNNYSPDEIKNIEYFLKINFLRKKSKKYEITIPLLKKYIQTKLAHRLSISIDNENILVNGTRINDMFSSREKKLIMFLTRHIHKIVTRDEVAKILWNSDSASYSDWSLDMAINRLRNKLQKLGLNRTIIKTIKKQGFVFHN